MTAKIHPRHFPKLNKVVDLYFRIQHLKMPQYFLVPNTPLQQMTNTIFTFSDGSQQFATSVIYLLSYDNESSNFRVSLVSSLCKLNASSKATPNNTVPKSEFHGVFLACNGAMTFANVMKQIEIQLHNVYIFSNAVAHIIAF